MGRPRNSLNVTEVERERIRELYRQGLRLTEICRRTGRSDSVVSRTVRGMKRPKPPRRRRVTQRNALIARRVLDEGVSQAVMARRFTLTPTSICLIVKAARKERAGRTGSSLGGGRSPAPTSRGSSRSDGRPQTQPATRPLTRQQTLARNRLIRRLVLLEGVPLAVVGRRYGLSAAAVRRIATSE